MTMADNTTGRPNRFETHPVITMAAVILLATMAAAAVFLLIYRLYLAPIEEEDLLDAAFTYREASPVFHHGLSANQAVDHVSWGPLTYRLRTNSLGFRDSLVRDIPLKTDAWRILFMGDSFTEGIGLPYEETFAGIIDRTLRDKNVDILNGAAISYSPIIYWRKTKHLIETVGLEFNELVVFLDISDVRDEAESYYLDEQGNVQSRLFEDRKTRKKILGRIRDEKIVNSLSRYLAVLMDFSTGPAWETGRWTIDPELFERYGRSGLAQMTVYMDRLRMLLESHDIKLTVAVYPWPVQIREKDLESIQATYWEEWCRRHGIEFINYFPVFNEQGQRNPQNIIDQYFIPGDSHWNRQGHELIARVFCERFLARTTAP